MAVLGEWLSAAQRTCVREVHQRVRARAAHELQLVVFLGVNLASQRVVSQTRVLLLHGARLRLSFGHLVIIAVRQRLAEAALDLVLRLEREERFAGRASGS